MPKTWSSRSAANSNNSATWLLAYPGRRPARRHRLRAPASHVLEVLGLAAHSHSPACALPRYSRDPCSWSVSGYGGEEGVGPGGVVASDYPRCLPGRLLLSPCSLPCVVRAALHAPPERQSSSLPVESRHLSRCTQQAELGNPVLSPSGESTPQGEPMGARAWEVGRSEGHPVPPCNGVDRGPLSRK
jgi:hypothetical protein